MSKKEVQDGPNDTIPNEIAFHYLKSNFFRVIRADGAYGGVTARGAIHMAIYSERTPIPVQTVSAVNKDGTLGDEIGKTSRDGMVREVEVDVMMSPETARSLAKWLLEKAETAIARSTEEEEAS